MPIFFVGFCESKKKKNNLDAIRILSCREVFPIPYLFLLFLFLIIFIIIILCRTKNLSRFNFLFLSGPQNIVDSYFCNKVPLTNSNCFLRQ